MIETGVEEWRLEVLYVMDGRLICQEISFNPQCKGFILSFSE